MVRQGRSVMRGFWTILTLNCEQSSRLLSDCLDRDLSLSERIALRLHTAICRPCRHLRTEMDAIKSAAGRIDD